MTMKTTIAAGLSALFLASSPASALSPKPDGTIGKDALDHHNEQSPHPTKGKDGQPVGSSFRDVFSKADKGTGERKNDVIRKTAAPKYLIDVLRPYFN